MSLPEFYELKNAYLTENLKKLIEYTESFGWHYLDVHYDIVKNINYYVYINKSGVILYIDLQHCDLDNLWEILSKAEDTNDFEQGSKFRHIYI